MDFYNCYTSQYKLIFNMKNIACVQQPRLDLFMQEYLLSNTNANIVIDNAIAGSRLRSRMFVEQS